MTGWGNEWISMVINLLCAWIAVDYMDRAFVCRYSGSRRYALFACGAAVYFCFVTAINDLMYFEGWLGLGYGLILFAYALAALSGAFAAVFLLMSGIFLLDMIWLAAAGGEGTPGPSGRLS